MSLIEQLRRVRAVVIGDVMLDEHIWGRVHRISPEAPVPVVEVLRRNHVPGGAANAAVGVVALGGSATLGGVVGNDGAAHSLREALRTMGVDASGVLPVMGRCTTTKTRVLAHSQHVVRIDSEERTKLPEDVERALMDWAERALDRANVVIVSDYCKGVVTTTLAIRVIELAKRSQVPIVVDAKGDDLAKYVGATVITPNIAEARRAVNISQDAVVGLEEIAARLERVIPGSALLITRGADGMTLFGSGGRLDVPADAREVYDVTGAGDTVVAVLAAGLGYGLELEEAVPLANAAAGIVVSKAGTATVSAEEILERHTKTARSEMTPKQPTSFRGLSVVDD